MRGRGLCRRWQIALKLGCTSYVYPADMVSNVRKLAGLVDDIELLIFEGADREVLPTRAEVSCLLELSSRSGFSYTVHLPVDIDVCSPDKSFRNFSLDRMDEITDLTAPLSSRGFVLHLPGGETGGEGWTETAVRSARDICRKCDGELFVENLEYPFEKLVPVFEQSRALLCLDIGHAYRAGDSWKDIYRGFADRTRVVHFYLHDRGSGRHKGFQDAPLGFVSDVTDTFLSDGYDGVLTIEMFGEREFFKSKEIVEKEIENWAKR